MWGFLHTIFLHVFKYVNKISFFFIVLNIGILSSDVLVIILPRKYFSWSLRLQIQTPKEVSLKNFAIFTEKRLCWSLFLINLQVWRPATLLKRDSNIGVLLLTLQNFSEHLRTAAFKVSMPQVAYCQHENIQIYRNLFHF